MEYEYENSAPERRYKTRSATREQHAIYLKNHEKTQEEYDAEQERNRRYARGKNTPDPDSDPEVVYTIRRKKTRSMQRERRARRKIQEQAGGLIPKKKNHEYTPDYRFYLKGGDVYLVVENVLFCVHVAKLASGDGFFADVLQSSMSKPDEMLNDRPVVHIPLVNLREMRFYLAYLYHTIIIHRELPSGTPLIYWEAAISVLSVSHAMGNNTARQAAIKGLRCLFPLSSEPVAFKPAIAGLRTKEEETNFYRTFPLQAIPILRKCDLDAMLPMAYYHAAQLSTEDLTEGVKVGDQLFRLDVEDVRIALMGHETLKNARKNILFEWLHVILRDNGPRKASMGCADLDLRGGLACYPFLVRLLEHTAKNPHSLATHSLQTFSDNAKEILQENLCFHCLQHVLSTSDGCLAKSWEALPECFGFQPWEVILARQASNEEAWSGNYN